MNTKNTHLIAALLVAFGFAARLFEHPANVAPIGALALFAGIYLPKRAGLVIPLVALFLSDTLIGFYDWKMMAAVYGSFALMGAIGLSIRKQKSIPRMIGGTLLGSVLFYLITNTAVWAFGTMYPHTLTGLGQSLWMAVPFFRNSMIGDVFYMMLFVSSMEATHAFSRRAVRVSVE